MAIVNDSCICDRVVHSLRTDTVSRWDNGMSGLESTDTPLFQGLILLIWCPAPERLA